MTTTINITRKRGDTKRLMYIIKNSDDSVVNINSGFSFILTVDPSKDPVDNANNLFQITGVIVDGANGKVAFPLTDSQADQEIKTYYYDIQMTDPNSEKSTIVDGKFKFVQDITKD